MVTGCSSTPAINRSVRTTSSVTMYSRFYFDEMCVDLSTDPWTMAHMVTYNMHYAIDTEMGKKYDMCTDIASNKLHNVPKLSLKK